MRTLKTFTMKGKEVGTVVFKEEKMVGHRTFHGNEHGLMKLIIEDIGEVWVKEEEFNAKEEEPVAVEEAPSEQATT